MGGGNQTYPDDSLQWLVGTWRVEDEEREVGRGRLFEWLRWLFRDPLPADGVLADIRAELLKLSS